ncbi:MAG: hypothetical protein ACOCRZ_04065 [Halothermotrichaceae bacterium]
MLENCYFDEIEGNREDTGKKDNVETADNIIAIKTFADLEKIGKIGYPFDRHYQLANDIDASPTYAEDYNDGKGWNPIGEYVVSTNKVRCTDDRCRNTGAADSRTQKKKLCI